MQREESFSIEECPSSLDFPVLTRTRQVPVLGGGGGEGDDGDIDAVCVNVADGMDEVGVASTFPSSSVHWSRHRKWPTPWYWQLMVLTVRTFKQSRHVILSKLNCVQTMAIALVVSVIWFQIPCDEKSIPDRLGFVSGL